MIHYDKLVRFECDSLISVIKLPSDNPHASIGEIQPALSLGYARVGRIKECISILGSLKTEEKLQYRKWRGEAIVWS